MRLPAMFAIISLCLLFSVSSHAKGKTKPEYYQFESYYFSTQQQEALVAVRLHSGVVTRKR
jgi:hypothetical protein